MAKFAKGDLVRDSNGIVGVVRHVGESNQGPTYGVQVERSTTYPKGEFWCCEASNIISPWVQTFAHIFKRSGGGYQLGVTDSNDLSACNVIAVYNDATKGPLKKIAKSLGAKPWNY